MTAQRVEIYRLRVLSHLFRLPGPNPSSFAPPSGLRSYYFIWVRTAVHLRYQASSCLPRCFALLYIYVFEPFVLFTKLQCIKHLRLSYECAANALKNAEGEKKWDIQLSAFSASVMLVRKVSETHTNTHFLSNNTALIAVHFRDLVRLHSHQQRTVLEFTWTVPQTTLFKRTRVRFAGAHPRSEDSVHIIQTNRTQSNTGAHQKC